MYKQKYKGRCEKRTLSKCHGVCKAYDAIQSAYADLLQKDNSIVEFRCNVALDGLSIGNYTTDFVCTIDNGDLIVRECVFRNHLAKPMTVKLLDASRDYWLGRGVSDWGLVIDAEKDLIRRGNTILRVLEVKDESALIIDCCKRTMPQWWSSETLEGFTPCSEQALLEKTNMVLVELEMLDPATRKIVHDRYTIIAGVLPFVGDEKMRSLVISRIAEGHEICKQTVRNYLCLYLAYQDIFVLAPKRNREDNPLTKDEKHMRWALNKFFYTKKQNSLMSYVIKRLLEDR